MNCRFETPSHSSFFHKETKDFLTIHQESLSLECKLLKNQKKSRFFRFYETFMLISKAANFEIFKVVFYDSGFIVNFILNPVSERESSEKETLASFQIVSNENENRNEYAGLEKENLKKIFKLFKKVANLGCFHNFFKSAKTIGHGTFSTVYLSKNCIDNKLYAVKATSKAFFNKQKNGKASLLSEVQILRKLNHENIIRLDSVYETSNSFYLVFEMCMGGTLSQYIKKNGTFNETQASYIIRNVLLALKFTHEHNIMHRDIKPDNILFRSNDIFEKDQIVLADFGLATSNDVKQYLHPKCGTPGFAAPEIFAISNPEDHYALKCDLFSVGVTLYFMLTGHLPYQNKQMLHQENRDLLLDFQKCKEYRNLSPKAKDFLTHLVCKQEERLDVYQALIHPFILAEKLVILAKKVEKCSNDEDLGDDEVESAQRLTNILEENIKEFNNRKFNLVEKNLLYFSHGRSPVSEIKRNGKSLSFFSLAPNFNGSVKSIQSLNSNFSMSRDETFYNNLENEDIIVNTKHMDPPFIQERIKFGENTKN